MGSERSCAVTVGNERVEGRALLETSELLFRGALRLKIPFASIHSVTAQKGNLKVVWSGGAATFHLGDQAEKWLEKIKNPKGRIGKLGVKPASVVSVIGIEDASFVDELKRAVTSGRLSVGKILRETDLMFWGIESEPALRDLPPLIRFLSASGALWIVRPKGKNGVSEAAVRNACLMAGLVDVKVASFSPTHTAEKFVIPVANRRKGSSARP